MLFSLFGCLTARCSAQAPSGAQLYQMQQSPMPEKGETFRPARDILQELFLLRASHSQTSGGLAAMPVGTAGKAQAGETEQGPEAEGEHSRGQQARQDPAMMQQQRTAEESKHKTSAVEEPDLEANAVSCLSGQAQSWEPMWGPVSTENSLPTANLGPQDAVQSEGAAEGAAGWDEDSKQAPDAAQNTWGPAWKDPSPPGVPGQAAGIALAECEQKAAWDLHWDSSRACAPGCEPAQQDFMLLLPSREPPPPPAPAGPSAHSAAQRDVPLPVMRPVDRQKCERFYIQVCATALAAHYSST